MKGRKAPMQSLRYYDFFAGVGMVDLALKPVWECIWANDCDPKKALIYRANHGSERFHLGDVSEVQADDLPSYAEMAWASFPCQDVSLAGLRRGLMAERSGTFRQLERILRDLHRVGRRPPLIALENVVGLLQGPDFASICRTLEALDMQFGALVIDASKFLPQSRPRVFVVAVDSSINCERFFTSEHDPQWTPQSLIDAHELLPPQLQRNWRWWHVPSPKIPVSPVESLVEDAPQGVRWHAKEETLRLLDLMSPVNFQKVEQRLATDGRSVGFLYKRMRSGLQRAEVRFDGVAGCLRTPSGGSSRQKLMVIEKGEVRTRLVSPREAARLMGIPDTFLLPGSLNDAYRAMGDGVAVPVVRWLSDQLLEPIALLSREKEGRRATRSTTKAHHRSDVADLPVV